MDAPTPPSPGFGRLRQIFLAHFPGFGGFETGNANFHMHERGYKDELVARYHSDVQPLLGQAGEEGAAALHGAILALLTKPLPSSYVQNLVGWRTRGYLDKLDAPARVRFGTLAQDLLGGPGDVSTRLDRFYPGALALLRSAGAGGPAHVRSLATLLLMLQDPAQHIFVRIGTFNTAAQELLGGKLIGHGAMPTGEEYGKVLDLAGRVKGGLEGQGWPPRDMVDVQSFIWVAGGSYGGASEPDPSYPDDEDQQSEQPEAAMPPVNLILHGPPGTGKTYATAAEAVRLCDEPSAGDRAAVMEAYRRLTEAGRIEFVTFHQSFAYEDFVEGLRPVQESDGGSASFELRPVPGVFRKIAHRAATSRAPAEAAYSIEGRQVFKMSIGEASNPEDDDLFDTAIEQGFTRLNWDVVDWSDERFASRDEMAKELSLRDDKEVKPEGDRVRMQHEFRSGMRVGDLIIVSKGNSRFRAIGAVKGGYQFDKGAEAYAHKRAVQWLWVDPEGTDCKEIIDRWFSMKSIYRLPQGSLNVAALERVIGSQQSVGGPPQPFVLIIDEINRANVSKVFGELITLLEPDKRLGAANEVRVRLPYSGDLFGVPSNLHVVGTMNTADRSIALLDTALRRRFTFRELMPQPELLGAVDGIGLQALLTVLNQRIEYLFDREHQIGHAYFMGCQTRAGLDDVMRHKVIPLLAEYFFEDWGKVAAVLGDASEEEGSRAGSFLDRTQLPAPKGLGADAAPRYRWSVRPDFDYANLLKP